MPGTLTINWGSLWLWETGTQFFHLQDGCSCPSGPRGLHAPDVRMGPEKLQNGRPGLAEELPGVGGRWGRLGLGPGAEPTASASGFSFRLLPGFCLLFFGNTWAGEFTCLRPAAGSCANACYLSPRWAGPAERSVVARLQPGMCGPGAPARVGGGPDTSPFLGRRGRARGSPFSLDETAEMPSAPSFKSQANPGSERGGERLEPHSARRPPLRFPKIALKWGRAEARTGIRAVPTPSVQPLDAASRAAGGEGVR